MTSNKRSIAGLLARLWEQYTAITPQAARVHALLEARGETVVNDHIALRSFGLPGVSIDALARAFVAAGYAARGEYRFPQKRLRARHFEPPRPGLPKVFISELDMDAVSRELAAQVSDLVAAVPAGAAERWDFAALGRPWSLSHADYERLSADSDYAGWVAAFGFRANHFTVDVGALNSFSGLAELNRFVEASGLLLNDSGGKIKGGPDVYLEQSSTRADRVPVAFSDGTFEIPSCYYEFARRYRLPDGSLFQGFVTASADRIFESTDRR